MKRVNIGCGQTPTPGWSNYDNSVSLRLAKHPLITSLLTQLKIIKASQASFIQFAANHDINHADATKGIPLQSNSCDVIYSSHMLEHLDRAGADRFLQEAFRVLKPNGIVRLAVPDIQKLVKQYDESGNADAFIDSTNLCRPRPATFSQKLRFLFIGPRHHQWMYDGRSLSKLLEKHGFSKAQAMAAGSTNISTPGELDLEERVAESVYVEAFKPER
jgi:predicted SAM-dependent methyltransferase